MSKAKRKPRTTKTVTVAWNPRKGWWTVLDELRCAYEYLRKAPAVAFGRQLARHLRCELVVKNKTGRIAWRSSFGNDPRSRKG